MGIDAYAIKNAELAGKNKEFAEEAEEVMLFSTPYYGAFMHAIKGLELEEIKEDEMKYVSFEFLEEDWNSRKTAQASYAMYSSLRNRLAFDKGGFEELREGDAFFELCAMVDDNGFFSNLTCKKISNDFKDNKEKFFEQNTSWLYRDLYSVWADIFEEAANNDGIVVYT